MSDLYTATEGEILIKVARDAIEKELFGSSSQSISEHALKNEKFWIKKGVFVTLEKAGQLRGCIGHIVPILPVIEGIRENAINAAFRDPRFPPLSKTEYPLISVEISILTEPKPLYFKDPEELLIKLKPKIHGVILKKRGYQSTFLPQVWEQLPDKKQFLSHLAMKAGLPPNAWMDPDVEVFTYEVQKFEEKK